MQCLGFNLCFTLCKIVFCKQARFTVHLAVCGLSCIQPYPQPGRLVLDMKGWKHRKAELDLMTCYKLKLFHLFAYSE